MLYFFDETADQGFVNKTSSLSEKNRKRRKRGQATLSILTLSVFLSISEY